MTTFVRSVMIVTEQLLISCDPKDFNTSFLVTKKSVFHGLEFLDLFT